MTGQLLGLGLAAAALLVWPGSGGMRDVHRLSSLHPQAKASPSPPSGEDWHPWLVGAAAGASAAVVVGGAAGLVVAVVVTVAAARWLSRQEPRSRRRWREQRATDLPAALDLLSLCLRSGTPIGPALKQVASVLDGSLAADLSGVAALHELGAEAPVAWSELAEDPVLAPVARAVARTAHSGSALAAAFESVASQLRGQRQQEAEAAARRAAVLVMAPLGLCFLPAFVCLGVVPTVLGVAATVLH